MTLVEHDPADRSRMAYLSSTKEGRRVYLNRHVTDADVVIPVGRVGYDPVLGYRGPWSVLFPGLSDQDTGAFYRHRLPADLPGRAAPPHRLDEPLEVTWLLGSQFHVGLFSGNLGMAEALAGLAEPVRDEGIRRLDRLWNFQAPARAECVVAGIGAAGAEAGIGELVEGLATASRLVNHGGKIVAVSRAGGRSAHRSSGSTARKMRERRPRRCAATTQTPTRLKAAGWPRFWPGPTFTCTAVWTARSSRTCSWFPSTMSMTCAGSSRDRARAWSSAGQT